MRSSNAANDRKSAQQRRLKMLLDKRSASSTTAAAPAPPATMTPQEVEAILDLLTAHEKHLQGQLVGEEPRQKVITKSLLFEQTRNQGSKANPSTYYHKEAPAFDKVVAANVHHSSSHYVMAGTKQFLKGVRVQGVVARHSRQAAIRNGHMAKKKKQNTVNGVHNKSSSSSAILM
jgi:hypothetical protein